MWHLGLLHVHECPKLGRSVNYPMFGRFVNACASYWSAMRTLVPHVWELSECFYPRRGHSLKLFAPRSGAL